MKYIGNAFSLQMLDSFPASVVVEEIAPQDIPEDVISVFGHSDTAAVVSSIVGRNFPYNRVNVSLGDGDELYVAQIMGGRLPEGSTSLPAGFTLKFLRVTVK